MAKKISVGVLGATGMVGQRFIERLVDHPLFEISELVASNRSSGKAYKDAATWRLTSLLPESVGKMVVKEPNTPLKSKILFSALDSSVAGEAEESYRKKGHAVFSNSKNHRMDNDVPLLVPEINIDHMELIKKQQKKHGGFIVTNPNCSTTIMALGLYPIYRELKIKRMVVTTMQAISGAGLPGVPSLSILSNLIPYISDEEPKVESEAIKIFGDKNLLVSAQCNRVPVIDGHTISLSFETVKKKGLQEIERILTEFKSPLEKFKLPSAPLKPITYLKELDRPQPLLDVNRDDGMGVSVGRLRECPVLGQRMVILGNNVIRGAAGGAILNAEYFVKVYGEKL